MHASPSRLLGAAAHRGSSTAPASFAVVLSGAVGDSVMMMWLVHEMVRNGHETKVYGRVGQQLARWYPWCETALAPDPSTRAARPHSNGDARFDVVIELYASPTGDALSRTGRSTALAAFPGFRRRGEHMLDSIGRTGAEWLGLRECPRSSGIVIPQDLTLKRMADRVVIHPTASHPEKAWAPARFKALARRLKDMGLHPSFIVPPAEYDAWRDEEERGTPVRAFPTLDGVAGWIAESGWFIGNDSGPGHLAAAIGIPTLSLFMRQGLARSWRPAGRMGRVVLPPRVLPGAWMRERLWQRALSERRVLEAFDSLRRDVQRADSGVR